MNNKWNSLFMKITNTIGELGTISFTEPDISPARVMIAAYFSSMREVITLLLMKDNVELVSKKVKAIMVMSKYIEECEDPLILDEFITYAEELKGLGSEKYKIF